jgi:hypothetical protein
VSDILVFIHLLTKIQSTNGKKNHRLTDHKALRGSKIIEGDVPDVIVNVVAIASVRAIWQYSLHKITQNAPDVVAIAHVNVGKGIL